MTRRGARAAALVGLLLLQGCLFAPSSRRDRGIGFQDAPFRIGDVDFPNDAAYARAFPEATPDARMARFLQKCATGGAARIGFLGGSITEGANASSGARRYSTLFTDYIRAACPALASVTELNAGIGATGSRYGASRVADDLLPEAPDLVVIEFAVNDFEADPDAQIRATMEGLVRRVAAADAAVLLLFTAKGDLRNTQDLHAEVADHYGAPRVSYRDVIRPLIDSGRIAWSDVFDDDPHPNDAGHRLIAHLLSGYLKKASGVPGTGGGNLPAPRFSDLYTFAGAMKPGDGAVTAAGD